MPTLLVQYVLAEEGVYNVKAGAGVGYHFGSLTEESLQVSGKWTGKIEYLYVDYGTVSGTFVNAGGGIQANFSSHITDHVLRAGVNYHF